MTRAPLSAAAETNLVFGAFFRVRPALAREWF
jgi:hypothetical protein